MRSGLSFLGLFALLLALTAFPAWKLLTKFNSRLAAYEQQKRVDLKRGPLEELQQALRQANERAIPHAPRQIPSAKSLAEEIRSGTEPVLSVPPPLNLSIVNRKGQILSAMTIYSFDQATADCIEVNTNLGGEPVLTKAVGNVIRGLEGFSLGSYRDAQGREVYGAWLWDRPHEVGIVLEVPAESVNRPLQQELTHFQKGRRFLYFMCAASYLMILSAVARALQYVFHKRKATRLPVNSQTE